MKCPRCESEAIVEGRYLDQVGGGFGQKFRPGKMKFFAFFGTDISIPSKFTACTECGLLWNEINQEKLVKVIGSKGRESLKEAIKK